MPFTISFDLDDTLIPGVKRFPVERRGLWQQLLAKESLRKGTIHLMKALKERKIRVFIYTTSYRSPSYIRRLFFSYGIFPEKIINKEIHDKTLGERGNRISKYPPAFNIDWHIDDSPGVAIEGERYQFKTIIVSEDDADWGNTILSQLVG
ncbi:hypothetical protein [Chitinophaga arvensicola]|uniref:HAD superfamily, subfamily IIIB (Acid phosphatase) n=1 Tax=Chitinophaga arvensicola TaxID=29529 RepID=A0A1I0S5G1_9BACT|nr:hypothetical protein [Chitinophaga arvensicola]SEW50075.1 hypothetical protein SAMN04488122_3678 [Chitinophaga arvensicola]